MTDSINNAFSKVKTVGDDVVEELREKWLAKGTSSDIVKDFLLEQEQQARDSGLDRAQMKQKMMDIWKDQRYLVERIVRTETINGYSRAQLQEWFDQGIKQVERIEVNDIRTCDKCRALSQPGQNIYFIEDILQGKLTGGKNNEISSADYPVSYCSHPNCFIDAKVPIYTSKGWKKIRDIKVGDLVLTHRGRFRKVTALLHSPYEKGKPIVSIHYEHRRKTAGFAVEPLTMTPEHPVFIVGKGWVNAGDVKTSDRFLILANKCGTCGKKIHYMESYCSGRCASKNSRTQQLKKEKNDLIYAVAHHEAQSRAMIKRHRDDPAATLRNLKQFHKNAKQMIKDGTHPLQKEDTRIKSMAALAKSHHGLSFLEKKMKWLLEQKGILFKQQYPIHKGTDKRGHKTNYFIDFFIPEHKIAIECDGIYWHDEERDRQKSDTIKKNGFLLLRFTENQIRNDLKSCSNEIDRILKNHKGEYEFVEWEVKKVEYRKLGKNRRIYNFSVEEDESYVAKGMVVHNCRGGYRPVSSYQTYDDFAKMMESLDTNGPQDFQSPKDIESYDGQSKAENVPLEYQKQVQQAVDDFGPSYGIKFVPEITDDPDWQSDQLEDLLHLYSLDEAEQQLEVQKSENRGKILQYKTKSGNTLVSGDAGSVNHVVIPVLRQHAEDQWNAATEDQRQWFTDRYNEKIKEMSYTLKDQGIQIFGDSPFVTPLAKESAQQYFIETYIAAIADPVKLRYYDPDCYDYLIDNFLHHEYLSRGGIN
jgi:very-short-patch-repair endonuclease